MVELALVLPLFLLLFAGIFEAGRAYFVYQQLQLATQEGARYAAVLGYTRDDRAIEDRVRAIAPLRPSDSVTIAATVSAWDRTPVVTNSRAYGNLVTVSAQYRYTVFMPLFSRAWFPMTASSGMVIEREP
jgi:Flp pilus assembly protein TadG